MQLSPFFSSITAYFRVFSRFLARFYQQKTMLFLFYVTTIIPSGIALFYFSLMASDVYISESSFVVRSQKSGNYLTGMNAVLSSAGFSRAQDDNYSLNAYLTSRNAMVDLERKLPLRAFYTEQGDYFSRFAPIFNQDSQELFYQYFNKQLNISLNSTSGITYLRIKAFSPQNAQQINELLLKQGEAFINRLNERAQKDTVNIFQKSVDIAEKRVTDSAIALRQYRIKNGIFDIYAQSEEQMGLVSQLKTQLSGIQTKIAQIRAVSPKNPQLQSLMAHEESLKQGIALQTEKVLGKQSSSIVNQSAEYQRLLLNSELAKEELTSAITALHNIKVQMSQQRLYLEVIDHPSTPDYAEEPKRLYAILSTFFIGLILFGISVLILNSIREHRN